MARLLDRWAVEDAIKRSNLPSPARLILFVLLTHVTNGTLTVPSEYSPSITTLIEETGLSRGALTGHLNRLEGDGWLQRFRPTTKEALSVRARTSYRMTVPGPFLASAGGALVQEAHQPGTSSGDERVTRSGDGPVQEMNQFTTRTGSKESQVGTRSADGLVQEMNGTRSGAEHNPMSSTSSPSEKKRQGGAGGTKRARKSDDEHPRFAEFYAAYPKKADPADARRAFNRAVKKVDDPQTLIDGAARYAREKAATEKRYIKAPAVWLNKESWLNEPEESYAATGTDGRSANRFGPLADVNDQWAHIDPENFNPFQKGNGQ